MAIDTEGRGGIPVGNDLSSAAPARINDRIRCKILKALGYVLRGNVVGYGLVIIQLLVKIAEMSPQLVLGIFAAAVFAVEFELLRIVLKGRLAIQAFIRYCFHIHLCLNDTVSPLIKKSFSLTGA